MALVVHGDKLISSSMDSTIKVWNTDTWACEHTIEGHGGGVRSGGVRSLVVHGDKLFSGSEDFTIKVWSTGTWACERTLGSSNANEDMLSDDEDVNDAAVMALVVHGDKLLSGCYDRAVRVWGS
jgi:WD40 repeat protein